MEQHLKEIKLRSFILIKLLNELIDRRHAPFADNSRAAAFKARVSAAVAQRYPEQEGGVPEDEQQGTIPPVILAEIEKDRLERDVK